MARLENFCYYPQVSASQCPETRRFKPTLEYQKSLQYLVFFNAYVHKNFTAVNITMGEII
jgi:hypothetical protein